MVKCSKIDLPSPEIDHSYKIQGLKEVLSISAEENVLSTIETVLPVSYTQIGTEHLGRAQQYQTIHTVFPTKKN